MALPTASDNPFPSLLIVEGTEPSAPSAGRQRLYIDSTTHKLMLTNSSGTESAVGPANTGSVATDTMWAAAGDIAVATGNDAAAVLSIGNAGGNLARINGTVQWDSRTSMPTAATGDRVWRSDLGSEYYYDGTRWLSTVAREIPLIFSASFPPLTASGVNLLGVMPGVLGGSDIWLSGFNVSIYINGGTALSASHKWVGSIEKLNTAGASAVGTITIDSGSLSQWRPSGFVTVNAAAAVSSGYCAFQVNWTKTGTPGGLYSLVSLVYRTVAT